MTDASSSPSKSIIFGSLQATPYITEPDDRIEYRWSPLQHQARERRPRRLNEKLHREGPPNRTASAYDGTSTAISLSTCTKPSTVAFRDSSVANSIRGDLCLGHHQILVLADDPGVHVELGNDIKRTCRRGCSQRLQRAESRLSSRLSSCTHPAPHPIYDCDSARVPPAPPIKSCRVTPSVQTLTRDLGPISKEEMDIDVTRKSKEGVLLGKNEYTFVSKYAVLLGYLNLYTAFGVVHVNWVPVHRDSMARRKR